MPEWVTNPPPLIRPVSAGSQGLGGPVPLPFSISWQRYTPTELLKENVQFLSFMEPEVLVVVLQDQLNSFLKNESYFEAFISSLRSLQPERRVSVIIYAPKRPSSKEDDFVNMIVRLQFEARLIGVQQAFTVQNLAVLIGNYTKAICQRPFKQNRLDDRHGFSFLPSAANTVAGAVAAPRFPLTAVATLKNGATLVGIGVNQKEALRSWAHRTWLRQLATWRGMTGEVVNAVAEAYPTPRALYNALRNIPSEEAIKRLGDLRIRRGAGVLATETRLGNTIASRIVNFFTSLDPNLLIGGDL
nr:crossover junction endonuclease EME1 [Hymenolepis microstoma]